MPTYEIVYAATDDGDLSSDGGEEQEQEELADQLSPSDGLTSPSSSNFVPHVPNVIIPDPTLQHQQQIEAEAVAESKKKAREAGEAGEASEDRKRRSSRSSTERVLGRYVAANSDIVAAYSRGGDNSAATPFDSSAPPAAGPHSSFISQPGDTYSSRTTPLYNLPSSRGRTASVYSDAPPAYTPSPTSPFSPSSSSQQQYHNRNYSTFAPIMGRPEADIVEQEGLLAREPESMADHPGGGGGVGGDDESLIPAWRRRVRRQLPPWLNYKVVLLSLALMGISVGFLANAFRDIRNGQETSPYTPHHPAQPISEQPVAGSPSDPAWVPFGPVVCKDAGFRWQDEVLPLVFSHDRNVAFVEELDEQRTTGRPVRVAGHVQVLQVGEGDDPRILLEIASNDEDIPIDVLTDEGSQAMRVKVPSKFDSAKYRVPCVEMRATIFVPRDGDIGGFTVGTVHLDISLIESLSVRVAEFSKITSVAGDITSASGYPPPYEEHRAASSDKMDLAFVPARGTYNFHSRVIEISTTSGRIHGNWPLFDMLGLHTTSGDIQASITPKDALASDPKPAVLSISSISGNIQAAEPIHGEEEEPLPLRDYLVDVKSTSGNLRCALATGAGTHLKSISGDITVDLQPVINRAEVTPEQPAQLETITTSGPTTVRVLEPLWFEEDGSAASSSDGKIIDRLDATHKSSSGNVRLNYPQSWEGNLFAESMSGSMKLRGKDVKVVRKSTGWPRSLHARKGEDSKDASIVRAKSLSGDLDVVIGDV